MAENPTESEWPKCTKAIEYCTRCGAKMQSRAEFKEYDRDTGNPTYREWHYCPTWFGSSWGGFASPGNGHDNHNAENVLSHMGYI